MDSFKDCFEKGLLRNTKKQPDLAVKDLKVAEFYLKEAEDQIDLNKDIMAALALYNAYFHCVRSLLFNDGVKERSHFCIARYLEKYVNESKIEVKFLNAFETVMSIRHNAQYSTEKIEIEEDLTELYNMCAELIKHIAVFIK